MKPIQSFRWRFTRQGFQWKSELVEQQHTDISRTWAAAVTFLVLSCSCKRDNVKNVQLRIRIKQNCCCSEVKIK